MADELARRGARVALLARDPSTLRAAQQALERRHAQPVEIAVCDLRERAQIERALAALFARWGRVDVLINNAGIIRLGPAQHKPLSEYEAAMAVHFWAPLYTMQMAIPAMRRQGGGRIVNISAIEGKVAFPHMAPYCASKFALTGLSDALRAELAREHIYVTTVLPGLMHAASPRAGARAQKAARLFSLRTERAARRIVHACRKGQRSLELGLSTKLLIRAADLAPGAVGALMEWVNRLLPRA